LWQSKSELGIDWSGQGEVKFFAVPPAVDFLFHRLRHHFLKTVEALWDDSRMGLRKEFVRLLADKVAVDLVKQEMIEVPEGLDLAEMIFEVMDTELNLEDKINEEVRVMLNQYQDQMRLSGASYQEMFKLLKAKLVKERKVVL